ncbi:hypothetical protein [Streptomyces kanamyceticus]|uniref:Uncharacterized protein n=1 Tax=Streptomyces kanamyceticus TaxID=1967 RepID=A0A5J6GLT0_STRKN|nr:hypothetical protein [Streptomyces kanamyceticus]QEU93986.1 hypothetical protein CP970_26535 [Streptomyces kanamyceticus]
MGLLNWHSGEHFDHRGACPCTLCGKSTPLRSHTGEAVHKVCAEAWNEQHPGADRFCSDRTPKRQNEGDHA